MLTGHLRYGNVLRKSQNLIVNRASDIKVVLSLQRMSILEKYLGASGSTVKRIRHITAFGIGIYGHPG